MDNLLLAIAGLAALGGICQWLAWRLNLPSILFLLTAGILVGPILGIFDPDALLGDLLFPFVSVAVAIILFEGGLTLKISDIREHGAVVTRLISVGVLITWLMLATAVHFVFDMPWPLALVFGSITVVSGPTVVKPLLRAVRPSENIGHILHWEGILIDPIGVFLALLVFDYVLLDQPGNGLGHIAIILAKLVIVGTAIGAASGFATAYALRRYLVPDYLVNVLTLITVICAFVLAETIQHESGLLAVTIMGVWLANTRGLHVEELLHFKEDLVVLLISSLFIVLASRLDISLIPQYGWQILLLLAIAQFVIRPINAWVCTIGSGLSIGERGFIGWLAPRGIVAAAVSSVFVLRLQEANVAMADLLVPLTFSLIIGTVVFQSLTAKPLADRLGISNPEPNGILFFGANEIALILAKALQTESIRVLLSDTSWRNVSQARRAGFDAYHGNPTSGHAEENLDLEGIGNLIAVSSNRDANALASIHFRSEFGSSAVFTLEGASDDDIYERFDTANRNRANPLFDDSLSYASLLKLLREGEIRHLVIPEEKDDTDENSEASQLSEHSIDSRINDSPAPIDEQSTPDDKSIRLFAIDKDSILHIYGAGEQITPKPGWRLIVLNDVKASNG
ncbi:MAG: sodium:proton antiporter [Granulosicoccus sp.]